jgi:hypothetical protein
MSKYNNSRHNSNPVSIEKQWLIDILDSYMVVMMMMMMMMNNTLVVTCHVSKKVHHSVSATSIDNDENDVYVVTCSVGKKVLRNFMICYLPFSVFATSMNNIFVVACSYMKMSLRAHTFP